MRVVENVVTFPERATATTDLSASIRFDTERYTILPWEDIDRGPPPPAKSISTESLNISVAAAAHAVGQSGWQIQFRYTPTRSCFDLREDSADVFAKNEMS